MGSWFRNELRAHSNLTEGERFRRRTSQAIVETARILAVVPDLAGIPHVRFRLEIAGSSGIAVEQRTLAADSFTRLYSEQVAL